MIEVQCPRCKQFLMASDEQAGGMMPCRHCGTWVTVPRPEGPGRSQDEQLPCPFCAGRISIREDDIGIPISCPHCHGMIRVARDAVTGRLVLLAGVRLPVPEPVPWEDRTRLGFWRALWQTLRGVALAPSDFFRRQQRGGLGNAVLFAVLMSFPAQVGSLFQQAILADIAAWLNVPAKNAPRKPELTAVTLVIGLVVFPICAVVGLFIGSALSHLALMVLGAARGRFEATCRVLSYCYGINILGLVPICGGLVAPIWFIVIATIGIRETHRTGTLQALLAVLAPMILVLTCCCLVIISVFALIGLPRL